MHLFTDKSYFTDLNEEHVPVAVANNNIELTQGSGTCEFIAHDKTGTPTAHIDLKHCAYCPSLGVNILCAKLLKERGVIVDTVHNSLEFPGGAKVHFDDDFTFDASPIGKYANAIRPSAILSRGKHGPTHSRRLEKSEVRQAKQDLWMARLNDPNPLTLNKALDATRGMPKLLREVEVPDAMTDARLLADGKRPPVRARSDPVTTIPGASTSFDHWSSTVESVLGANGVIAGIDNATSHFRIYPVATKSECFASIKRYYADAAHDGVTIPAGAVNYSDNENIFKDKRIFDFCVDNSILKRFAVEYEPWGNGGVEAVFSYWVDWMRRLLARGSAPDEFWIFAGMRAEYLLNALRTRDGKSVRESWCGQVPDLSTLKTLFCKAIVQEPRAWHTNKIHNRSALCVYLGEARNKAGSVFYDSEIGICYSSRYTLDETVFPFADGTVVFNAKSPQRTPAGSPGGAVATYAAPAAPGGEVPTDETATDADETATDADEHEGEEGANVVDEEPAPDDDNISLQSGPGPATVQQPQPPEILPATHAGYALRDRNGTVNFITKEWCEKTALNMITVGLVPSQSGHACAALPVEGEVVPSPHDLIDDIEDEIWRAAWKAADTKELSGILKWATTHKVKNLPKGTKVLTGTMQRKIKRDGTKKSRFCVHGFLQRHGIHFDRKSCPAMAHSSLRTICSLAAALGADIDFCDFTAAYTQSELLPDEYIYVQPPPGWRVDADGDDICYHLTRSLYGMKQSGRNWFMRIRKWIVDQGYTESTADACVFFKRTEKGVVMLGLYVDDLVIAYTDREARDELVANMRKEFEFTDQGRLTDVLGIQVIQTDESITLTQTKYIEGLVDTYMKGQSANRKDYRTPTSDKLADMVAAACDSVGTPDKELLDVYRSLVGSLLYCAVCTRPDISYAVGMLARAMNKPTEALLDEAKRVLHYLHSTKNMGLRYMRNVPIRLYGMSDSDWTTRRSTSGFAFFLAGAAIAYLSKKQPTTAMSSTEAEIMAGSLCALEAVYLRMLLEDLGHVINEPIELWLDNKGAIDLAHDYRANERTKHIERRHFKIRELVEEAAIRVKYVASESNIADIFTKCLSPKKFEELRNKLLNMVRVD